MLQTVFAAVLLAGSAALVAVTAAPTSAETAVCPAIAPADTHFLLNVTDAAITLPNGQQLKQGLLYNSSYVGPLLTAQLGEDISVDVTNRASVGTSVHWHGMDLPNAAWADGVDGVTQEPIPVGSTFRYKFKAAPAGTLWYHSHVGMQFADGLRGPLIVTDPDDPYKDVYDEEVVLLLTDQNSQPGEEELRALQDGTASMSMGTCSNVSSQDWSDAPFTSILTNGKGFMAAAAANSTKKQGPPAGSPYVVKVEQGKRYRFRVIQGAASWGLKVTVTGHPIDIIALDGSNVKATRAKGFVFTPGERVDFILHANQPVGNYFINVATLTGNNSPALLSYVGADPKAAKAPQLSLGCDWALYDPGVLDFKNVTLKPHTSIPAPPPKPTMTLAVYLSNSADPSQSKQAVLGSRSILGLGRNASVVPRNTGCNKLPDGRASKYCWSLNWVQFEGADNGTPLLFPGAEPGNKTYVVDVPYGAVVDLALINPGGMVHPMHLHGQRFWVLGAGNGQILTPGGGVDYSRLNSGRAIMRDTQPVANAIPGAAAAGADGKEPQGQVKPRRGSPAQPAAAAATATGAHGDDQGAGTRNLLQGMGGMAGMQPAPKAAAAAPAPAAGAAKAVGMGTMAPAVAAGPPKAEGMDAGMAPAGAAQQQARSGAPRAAAGGMEGMQGMEKPAADPPAAASAGASMPPDAGAGISPGLGGIPAGGSPQAGMGGMPAGEAAPASLSPGYAVIRFKATNPGMWAFHCHIDLHANSGMMMVFRVAAPSSTSSNSNTTGAGAKQAGAQPAIQPWSLPTEVTSCGQAEGRNDSKAGGSGSDDARAVPGAQPPPPSRSAAGARLPATQLTLLLWCLAVVGLMMGTAHLG